ncbi:MAG TPA: VWA domain-containing protein [Verrucomicrobiae bacterium]|jgi:VWFA-related protein|nr:VWA domain-containing protein [Verrucomicrobiae bacterium]
MGFSGRSVKLSISAALCLLFTLAAVAQSSAPATSSAQDGAAQQSQTASAPQSQAAPAPPPSPADDSNETLTTIRTRTEEVNVVFTVTDKHGRRITNLKQGDFTIADDNKPPAQINSFRAEANLPLQVGLLIDASSSVRDRFKFEQEAAIEFLNQTIRLHYDKAFVIGFDVTPEVTQDFTDNTDLLARGVHELRPGGGTALYDALYYACRDKLMKEPSVRNVRRAIVLLSDGEDNQSHVTMGEAIEMAQRAEAIVYTISTNVSGVKSKYDKILERISDATGGRSFAPFQISDVVNAFADIQEELRSQYAIAYRPADFKHDGHYRTIEIAAKDAKNLRVRSRRGYFAPSAQ